MNTPVECIKALLKGIESKSDWHRDPELRGAQYGYIEALFSLGERGVSYLESLEPDPVEFNTLKYKIAFTKAELAAYEEALRLVNQGVQ